MKLRTLGTTAAALALAAALAGCGDDAEPAGGTASDPAEQPSTSSPAPADDPTTPAEEPTSTEPEPGTVAVPVYLVGDTPQGERLYREFVQVGDGDPLLEAATVLTGGAVQDPDYRTLLGNLGIESVSAGGDVIEVALTADTTTNDKAVSPEQGRLAVQSLVYTLQGTAQTRTPVEVTQGGVPVTLYGVDTAGGVEAAPELDVLAFVNITTPAQGDTVADTFTIEGRASSFEATVPWEIRDADGTVVKTGFTTAEGWIDKLWPFRGEVDVSDLAPGPYTLIARTDDPSDGEGPGPHEDTKLINVQ